MAISVNSQPEVSSESEGERRVSDDDADYIGMTRDRISSNEFDMEARTRLVSSVSEGIVQTAQVTEQN